MLPIAARMAQEIVVERDEEDPFGSRDARFRGPRTKRWVPSGEALQFVCWLYDLSGTRARLRLLEWAGIVCRALNDVRHGSDYFLSGNAEEIRETSPESAPRVTRSVRRDDATGRLVDVVSE